MDLRNNHDPESQLRSEYRRQFLDYLQKPQVNNSLGADFVDELRKRKNSTSVVPRMLVDVNALQRYDAELYRKLLREPRVVLPGFEEGLKDYLRTENDSDKLMGSLSNGEVKVGFVGEFGAQQFSPRSLASTYLSQLVNVVGIVTHCSQVCPKIVKSVHYCEETKLFTTQEYRDGTENVGLPTGSGYPTRDNNGNLLVTEFGMGQYRNYQVINIQELPEDSPPGQLPRSLEVILENDLVDTCKPGDRITICGIYRAISTKAQGQVSGLMRSVLIGNTVKKFSKLGNDKITTDDLKNFKNLSQQEDCLDQLAHSLAPSIYGHDWVKKAIVLLLVGGQEKNLENGIHLRGDINCLMVGDPGVAKSQLLRAVMHVIPEAVSTTGRGCSGVGLTAAIVTDSNTGERSLAAGAMVLADRGIVCIDEFDKMNTTDRVAIHEVMEQQTVTISKAGFHTSLNARCSVLAAANPLFGTFDDSKPITKNINLPDSLLSRFDMVFVMRDDTDEEKDMGIAKHVLSSHRFGSTQTKKLQQNQLNSNNGDDNAIPMYQAQGVYATSPHNKPPLTTDFLKGFLRYTKNFQRRRTFSDEAVQQISNYYVELRDNQTNDQSLPVTTRTLESLIRLATAHSKIRWSNRVDAQDVDIAINIMDIVMNRKGIDENNNNNNDTNNNSNDNNINNDDNMGVQQEDVDPLQQINNNLNNININSNSNDNNNNDSNASIQKQKGASSSRRRSIIGSKRRKSQDENNTQNKRARIDGSSGRNNISEKIQIEEFNQDSIQILKTNLGKFKTQNRFSGQFSVAETKQYLDSQDIEISEDNLSVFLTMASNTEIDGVHLWFDENNNTWVPL